MKLKSVISLVLCSMLVLSIMPVSAFGSSTTINSSFDQQIQQNTRLIEKYLAEQGTSVEEELQSLISILQSELALAEESEQEKFEALIYSCESLLGDYLFCNSGVYNSEKGQQVIRGIIHPIYTPAVAAVITFFSAGGYLLAAELLLHAKDNNVLDSTYYPGFGNRVLNSSVITQIRASNNSSGSDEFASSGTTVLQDLYYAIHYFNWEKNNSNQITIKDRYDFALGDYEGIAGAAIDTMYMAQLLGVIVPYQVRIVV